MNHTVGSPAHKAGLKPGDQILEVNGLNVRYMFFVLIFLVY